MAYSFRRGESILLAWQVINGDPSLVTGATASLRPALPFDPATVDPLLNKVADFVVALQAADPNGAYPAFWLMLLAPATSAALSIGTYLTDLRLAFSDGTVQIVPPVQINILEPATVA